MNDTEYILWKFNEQAVTRETLRLLGGELTALRAENARLQAELAAARGEWAEVVKDHLDGDAAIKESLRRNTDGNLNGGIYATIANALDDATALLRELGQIINPHESYDATNIADWARDMVEMASEANVAIAHAAELREKLRSFLSGAAPCDRGKMWPRKDVEELSAALATTTAMSLSRVKSAALRSLKDYTVDCEGCSEVVFWSTIESEIDRLEAE